MKPLPHHESNQHLKGKVLNVVCCISCFSILPGHEIAKAAWSCLHPCRFLLLVGVTRLELATSRPPDAYSNQLSYTPICFQKRCKGRHLFWHLQYPRQLFHIFSLKQIIRIYWQSHLIYWYSVSSIGLGYGNKFCNKALMIHPALLIINRCKKNARRKFRRARTVNIIAVYQLSTPERLNLENSRSWAARLA